MHPSPPNPLFQEMGRLWQEYLAQTMQSPEGVKSLMQLGELWAGIAAHAAPAYTPPHAAPPPATPAAAASVASGTVLHAISTRLAAVEQRLAALEQQLALQGFSDGSRPQP